MHDVFISYSHDNAEIRDAICRTLEAEGIKCWCAPRDIQPGDEWADAITNALKQCRVMILIFTERSNSSNQVLREVGLAVDLKKQIIPCRCDGTIPSGSMQYYLSTLHWMDLSGDTGKGLAELTALTRRCLTDTGTVKTMPEAQQAVKKKHSKLLIPGIATAVLVLTAGIFLLLNFRRPLSGDPEADPGPAAAETAADTGTRTAEINGMLYAFSPGEDSPGADDYLYALLDDNTIRLDQYTDTGTAEITIPEVIDGLPVIEIGTDCFADNLTIEKVTLPPTMMYLNEGAFAGCANLREIVFSDVLTEIDAEAFLESGLTDVVLPDSVTIIGDNLFYGCTRLETVFLPAGIDLVPVGAFAGTESLKSVTIAAEKVLIDIDAFDAENKAVLIGVPGSYTEKYARQKGFDFAPYEPAGGQQSAVSSQK